ncbi:MAG: hypothetical protein ABIP94_05960, partial [Planctomycetota bacterium]
MQHDEGIVASLLLAGLDLGDFFAFREVQLAPGQRGELADAQARVREGQVNATAANALDAQSFERRSARARMRLAPLLHGALGRRLHQCVDLLRGQRTVHASPVGCREFLGAQHVERVARPGATPLQVAPERLQRDLVALHGGGAGGLAWLRFAAFVRRPAGSHFAELQLGEEQLGLRDVQVGEGAGVHLVEREQQAFSFTDEVPRVLVRGVRALDVGLDELRQGFALALLERIDETNFAALNPPLVVDHLGVGRVLVAVADELAPTASDLDGVAVLLALVRLALAVFVDRTHGRLLLGPQEFGDQEVLHEAEVPPVADHGALHPPGGEMPAQRPLGADAHRSDFCVAVQHRTHMEGYCRAHIQGLLLFASGRQECALAAWLLRRTMA